MYQRWRALTFLHFACPPSEIQSLLPPGLTVDTFPDDRGEEKAWIGLVPFRMEGVRPRFLPALPGFSAFPETNVRTYVHRDGKEPGVHFFSLDAANTLACRVARRFFALPYHEAQMSAQELGDVRHYRSKRQCDGARCDVDATFGLALPPAEPGSLEFFLIERYLLYAHRAGRLYTGQVHHTPYPLRQILEVSVEDNLVARAGIQPHPFTHQIASDGVDVNIYPLVPCR